MEPINWYTEKALRTHKFQPQAFSRMLGMAMEGDGAVMNEKRTQQLIHGILGMVGESSEVMSVELDGNFEINSMKEIGDWMWYAAIAAEALGYTLDNLVAMGDVSEAGPNISQCSSIAAEHLKKWLFYGKEVSREEYASLIANGIAWIRFEFNNFDFQKILQMNVAKLEKRFPESFTPEAAIARIDA